MLYRQYLPRILGITNFGAIYSLARLQLLTLLKDTSLFLQEMTGLTGKYYDSLMFRWNSTQVYSGGSTVAYQVPLEQFPVFHRKGSILPLNVISGETMHGTKYSSDCLTLLISQLVEKGETVVREFNGISQEVYYLWDNGKFEFVATSHSRSLIVILRGVQPCEGDWLIKNELNETILKEQQSHQSLYEARIGYIWERSPSFSAVRDSAMHIRVGASSDGVHFSVSCIQNK